MAVTESTTGNFSATIVDAYIKKRILDHGVSTYRFRKAAQKDPLPAGNGTNIKFIRYNRLVLPTELTEGVPPTADQLEVETVTGQCKQFGQVVEITDVLELTMWHPVVKMAMEELAEGAARKDDAIIQNIIVEGSNVVLSNASGAVVPPSSRTTLLAGDVLDTATLRDAVASLEMGGTPASASGGAKPYENGLFLGILNRRCMLDLMDDSVWEQMATRQDKALLEEGEVYKWSKVKFQATNFSHEFRAIAKGTATPAGGTSAGGTLTGGEEYNWGYTKINAKRGLEEEIAGDEDILLLGGGDNSLTFTAPTAPGFRFNLYFDDVQAGGGTKRLIAEDIESGGVHVIDAISSSSARSIGAQPPGLTVYTNYILGSDAFAVVDLDSLKTLVSKGAQKSDPLDQVRTMGTKFFNTALILNNAFMCRIEAVSNY